MDGPAQPERLTARQAALAVGKKRKPIAAGPEDEDDHDDDGDRMSISSSSGSDWEADRRGKKSGRHAKKTKINDGQAKGKKASKATKGRSDATMAETDDVAMQWEGKVLDELSPADVLSALGGMVEKLQAQIQRIEEAKAKAERVFELRMDLPQPESPAQNTRMEEVDRQFRVLASMAVRDADMEMTHTDTTAMPQVEQLVKKLELLQDKIDKVHQDDGEVGLCLRGLPEALWTTAGEHLGLGGFLGLTSFMQSLSSVSTYFRALSLHSHMHPIVELHKSPPEDIATKLIGGLLSHCKILRVNHRPTPTLVRMLEGLAATLESIDLQGRATGNQAGGIRYRRGRPQRVPLKLERNNVRVVFPCLREASVRGGWNNLPSDRNYALPVLKSMSVGDTGEYGPRAWLDAAVADPSCSREVGLDAIADFLDMKSAESLVSLTGRVAFRRTHVPQGGYYYQYYSEEPIYGNAGNFANRTGRQLRKIEMAIGAAPYSADFIQKLHDFRTACVGAGASESYYSRFINHTKQGLGVHLPFVGPRSTLTECRSTLHAICGEAVDVTLNSHSHVTVADLVMGEAEDDPDVGQLMCPKAKHMTIQPSTQDQSLPLPDYLVTDPSSLFPSVECVVVKQEHKGSQFYDGGVDRVLGALGGSLRKVRVELSVPGSQNTTLRFVPEAMTFVAPQGRDLSLSVRWQLDSNPAQTPSVDWSLWGEGEGEEEGREAMGRVRSVDLEMRTSLHTAESKAMYRSLVACVSEAFAAFPRLECVVVSESFARFPLLPHIRQAAKKRVRVSVGRGERGESVEMRPYDAE
ncbi:unnamed protein product [Vitrella brassicaformis CCMP3155]|uniref:Uncharacterized protein n=3 Tax=Vitrella brassicaformis TaxID=1169539 RepID=A0A0G4G341_VITBC|nr:unnamed protein product [Vitrella brassicaformis CCMP3155]|eukprot:CEM22664.1 unnamed protein product [Vitrella brassicaformis CCMP3155]